MINYNRNKEELIKALGGFAFLIIASFVLINGVEARDKGDDIILTKGKLIMRGGKDKGKRVTIELFLVASRQ